MQRLDESQTRDMSLLSKRFTCIDPGEWPARTSNRPRVLVENPDRAQLQGAIAILTEAGYDVATCAGVEAGTRCPLVEFGHCNLVGEADVVVTSADLPEGLPLLELHESRTWPPVVVEATPEQQEVLVELLPDAIFVRTPVDSAELVRAVAAARASAA